MLFSSNSAAGSIPCLPICSFFAETIVSAKILHTMNTIIGEVIPIALILAVAVLIGLLSNESTERMRLLAGMALAVVGVLCLELLFLQT